MHGASGETSGSKCTALHCSTPRIVSDIPVCYGEREKKEMVSLPRLQSILLTMYFLLLRNMRENFQCTSSTGHLFIRLAPPGAKEKKEAPKRVEMGKKRKKEIQAIKGGRREVPPFETRFR